MSEYDKTDEELLVEAERLARSFYKLHGYVVREGYCFRKATHPQEQLMWDLVVEAYEHIEGTDLQNAVAAVDDDDGT